MYFILLNEYVMKAIGSPYALNGLINSPLSYPGRRALD
jgi:hypothetical protein